MEVIADRASKGHLRRYELTGMPPDLHSECLFQLRVFGNVPARIQLDTEGFVVRLGALHGQETDGVLVDSPPPPASAFVTTTTSPSVAVATLSAPVVHRPQIAWRAAIPPSRACRHVADQDWLAGPSHSGNEPASSSGTGTGMHLCRALAYPAEAEMPLGRGWLTSTGHVRG